MPTIRRAPDWVAQIPISGSGRRLRAVEVCALCVAWVLIASSPAWTQGSALAEPATPSVGADDEAPAGGSTEAAEPAEELTPERRRAREYESQFALDLPDEPQTPAAAERPSPFTPSKPAPLWRLIVDMLWKLALVIGIIWGLTWLLRKTRYAPPLAPDDSRMKVIDTLRLSTDRALHVVEVQGHTLLVGSAPSAITLVTHLDSARRTASEALHTDVTIGDEDEGSQRSDFFDSLVQAERSFDIADLEPTHEDEAGSSQRRSGGPDPFRRAMDVLESLERTPPTETGPRRGQGVYDRRGRLR